MVGQAVDLVIELAEKRQVTLFRPRDFADYFAGGEIQFLRAP